METISCQNQHEAFERQFFRVWFGFQLAALILLLLGGSNSVSAYVGLAIFAGVGAFLAYTVRWSVVDEVIDHGEFLVFRKDSIEYNVPLADISAIGHPFANMKGLVTVKTRRRIQSRRRFTFRGAPVASSFKAPPIFDELEKRIGVSLGGRASAAGRDHPFTKRPQ